MSKYTMKIIGNDEGADSARIIIEVNGFEIDVLTDDDGMAVDINRLRDSVNCTGCSFGWNDKHENE